MVRGRLANEYIIAVEMLRGPDHMAMTVMRLFPSVARLAGGYRHPDCHQSEQQGHCAAQVFHAR